MMLLVCAIITYFKIACYQSGTREKPRKDHVDGNRNGSSHFAISNLDVLYFGNCNKNRLQMQLHS